MDKGNNGNKLKWIDEEIICHISCGNEDDRAYKEIKFIKK